MVAVRPGDFGTIFFFCLLFNFILYLLYYAVTKCVYREVPSIRPLFFVILALIFWVLAIYFYTRVSECVCVCVCVCGVCGVGGYERFNRASLNGHNFSFVGPITRGWCVKINNFVRALICQFSTLDHGLLSIVWPNWSILLSQLWWHHLKGLFLSFCISHFVYNTLQLFSLTLAPRNYPRRESLINPCLINPHRESLIGVWPRQSLGTATRTV